MKFYGQDIIYDKENNIVKVWINKSFRNAWESRGWIGESIGLNNGIINYTITNKADLLVMIKSNKTIILSTTKINFNARDSLLRSFNSRRSKYEDIIS